MTHPTYSVLSSMCQRPGGNNYLSKYHFIMFLLFQHVLIFALIQIIFVLMFRIGVDAGGYEDTGVETVRCGLYSYLCNIITRKTCLPLHISTITALLGLLSVELKEFVQTGVVDLPDVTSESALVHDIRNWFSSLSKEQQSFSVSLIQSFDVHKNENAQCSYRIGHLGTASAL